MSRALGAAQAKAYYGGEYANGRESYYAENDAVEGEWGGRLADEYGLEGPVEKDQFERLVDGRDPHTGEQLVRHVAVKEYENEFGEKIKTSEHRAGWDATFSAPKTVSLAALVGGDKRIREAHRGAVEAALKAIEEYTQARLGGNHQSPMTGKFVAAKFEHDAARPDKETGYAAPQLHTHAVIFNLTKTEDGRTKPIQPLELYRSQQYGTAVYRAQLAERLQALGYEIEVDRRTGAPEIKGFTAEYVAANSPRREEVKREASEMKARLAEAGVTVKEGAGLNQAAAKTDRRSKHYDRAEMRRRHEAMDARHGHQAAHITARAMERGAIIRTPEEVARRAQESVTFARDNATEREAVADYRRVTADALRRNLGLTTYDAVKDEMARREASGEFVGIVREHEPKRVTTAEMLKLERANIEKVMAGQSQVEPISKDATSLIERVTAGHEVQLNGEQRKAVEEVLTSRDRITGLQGGAGTGKTTKLAVLKDALELSGYEVRGYAPTTRAAQKLAESGIETETLQQFIRGQHSAQIGSDNNRYDSRHNSQPNSQTTARKMLHVLDESSLASTRNVERFFARVGPEDRILLVGDSRQHQAVEAGSPFEQLSAHGMRTAKLTEVVRQKDESLKKVVEQLSAREVRAAVEELLRQGRVVEVPNDPNPENKFPERPRLEAIADEYVKRPDGTLIISPANRERVRINEMVRHRLQEQGVVGRIDHKTEVYVNRQDMTGAERTFAGAYHPGEDVVRYNTGSRVYDVKAGEYGRVTGNDFAENTITVRLEGGREITYNPKRLRGVSVYKESERKFAEGDRVQFRAPLHEEHVSNGELGRIEKIEDARYTVRLGDDRRVQFDAREFRHLDHGYAVTSYSSQGETVERVIVNADTKQSAAVLNQRMSYVAVSRARLDAKIFTDSAAKLGQALDRAVDKRMALEEVGSEVGSEVGPRVERKWAAVTAEDPCPVCRKPDYCSVVVTASIESAKGEAQDADEAVKGRHVEIFCRRVESARPGHGGWYHELPDGADAAHYEHIEKIEQNRAAPIERRDVVIKRMNELLTLRDRDRENLRERGLDDRVIEKYGYKSVPTKSEAAAVVKQLLSEGYDLKNVPGFYRPDPDKEEWRMNVGEWHAGLAVNALDVDGRVQGQQIRRVEVKPLRERETGDVKVDAETGAPKMEPRYVWLSSANRAATSKREAVIRHDGASPGSPVHYRDVERMRSSGEAILTEGVLKADVVASYTDRGVIGVAGVGNYPKEFGRELRERIPELKRVFVAYDADAVRNPQVRLHLDKLRENLREAGFETYVLRWEESQGKGLDDYLKNRLTKHFHHVKGAVRARWQEQVLNEVGWNERHHEAEHRAGAEQSNGHGITESEAAKTKAAHEAAYEVRLREIERSITVGDELVDRWRVEECRERLEARRAGASLWRYEVTDRSTGLRREMSFTDVEARAMAVSRRVADEQSPQTTRERDELREAFFAGEMNRHRGTLEQIGEAHGLAMRRDESALTKATKAFERSASLALDVRAACRAEGCESPSPIIAPEKLDELHERAVGRRDASQIRTLEELRRQLPEEFGDATRDEHTAGRLEGQLLVARVSLQAAEKRSEEFERAGYFRRFEVEGVLWSRYGVEHQLARAEAKSEVWEGRVSEYEGRTKLRPQNVLHLLDRGENLRLAEAARIEADGARSDVARLREIREDVVKMIESERESLRVGVGREGDVWGALSDGVETERGRRRGVGLGAAEVVLTEGEVRRLEAHAAALRDPELLRRCDELSRKQAAKLPDDVRGKDLSRQAARALAREQVAGIALDESIERLEGFAERRLDVPLLYKDPRGEERVATLRQVEPKTFGERAMQFLTETDGERGRRAAVEQAAKERHQQLLDDRERAGEFYTAAREIAERHIEQLHNLDSRMELPAVHYTAQEMARIETFAARQTNPELRAVYEEVVTAAAAERRVGYAEADQKTQTPEMIVSSRQGDSHGAGRHEPHVYEVKSALDSGDRKIDRGADHGTMSKHNTEHSSGSEQRQDEAREQKHVRGAASNDRDRGMSM